jgi:ubiquitin-conjugating enzyme E2 Z
MSPNPFENEPGFENANAEEDKQNQKLYIRKVRAR